MTTVHLAFHSLGGLEGHSVQFSPETAEQMAADLEREAAIIRAQESS
jgi:hypothetical protein